MAGSTSRVGFSLLLVLATIQQARGQAENASFRDVADRVLELGEETQQSDDVLELLGYDSNATAGRFSEIFEEGDATRIISVRDRQARLEVMVWNVTKAGWTVYACTDDGQLTKALQRSGNMAATSIPLATARPRFDREVRFWRNCLLTTALEALEQTWHGRWQGAPGEVFTAKVALEVSDNQLTGHIEWTLAESQREEYRPKIGRSGIEYVKGTFDPETRVVRVEGYQKHDPESILGLDKYELILAPNSRSMGGITWDHGTWKGRFHVIREITP
jgi:hypothetical protein